MEEKLPTISELKKRKVCDSCGFENPRNSTECKKCGKQRFAPAWVLAKRPINRQVSVEITRSNPQYGDPLERITLSKWWPGGFSSFNIPNISQWEKIEFIINNSLAPILGWQTTGEAISKLSGKEVESDQGPIILGRLWKDHPDILRKIVGAIDPAKLSRNDFDSVLEVLGQVSDALTNANAGFREAFISVVSKLPKQKQRALEDLDLLLKGWSLQTITNVAQQVRARIETIELFEKQIQDPRTFELYGDNSIHRILERSMWLIDERYWLLFSNSTLRKQIGEEMSKRDKKRYGRKRPDFVCGSVGKKLILLELKRPSHELSVDDLNQLETYLTIVDDYSQSYSSYGAYLIGTKLDKELSRRLKHRSSSFKVLTYSDILDNTRKRYSEFLESI